LEAGSGSVLHGGSLETRPGACALAALTARHEGLGHADPTGRRRAASG